MNKEKKVEGENTKIKSNFKLSEMKFANLYRGSKQ